MPLCPQIFSAKSLSQPLFKVEDLPLQTHTCGWGFMGHLEAEACPVCRCEFEEGEEVVILGTCNQHAMHDCCFRELLKHSNFSSSGNVSCPVCRRRHGPGNMTGSQPDGSMAVQFILPGWCSPLVCYLCTHSLHQPLNIHPTGHCPC